MEGKDPFGFRPLWNALLDIHEEFHRICEKHGLRYYVAFGTALGAIRHHGFIPWDDDFDVMMPREDYEKLWRIIPSELPSQYKFVDYHMMRGYPLLMGKIMDTRQEKVTQIEAALNHDLNQGLFIDIFPLDGFPSSKLGMRWHHIRYLLHRAVEWDIAKRPLDSKERIVGKIVGFLCHLFYVPWIRSQDGIIRHLDRFASRIPFAKSQKSGYTVNHAFFKHKVHQTSEFGEPKYVEFEQTKVPVPEDFGAYLKVEYGDYMRMPPEEKRRPHHIQQPIAAWKYGPIEL